MFFSTCNYAEDEEAKICLWMCSAAPDLDGGGVWGTGLVGGPMYGHKMFK